MIHQTYNEYHLGDNLLHLNFLRRMAQRYPGDTFVHACHECHHLQLEEVILENRVQLVALDKHHVESGWWINSWRNADNWWVEHPLRRDLAAFHIEFFKHLAAQMTGGRIDRRESPIQSARDLLFDYPALAFPAGGVWDDSPFDILLINSQPCSGQYQPYDGPNYFRKLVVDLLHKDLRVVTTDPVPGIQTERLQCTRDLGLTVSGIGFLSRRCRTIIGIPNGPFWPCLNVHNDDKDFVMLLNHVTGHEDLSGFHPRLRQVDSLEGLYQELRNSGIL